MFDTEIHECCPQSYPSSHYTSPRETRVDIYCSIPKLYINNEYTLGCSVLKILALTVFTFIIIKLYILQDYTTCAKTAQTRPCVLNLVTTFSTKNSEDLCKVCRPVNKTYNRKVSICKHLMINLRKTFMWSVRGEQWQAVARVWSRLRNPVECFVDVWGSFPEFIFFGIKSDNKPQGNPIKLLKADYCQFWVREDWRSFGKSFTILEVEDSGSHFLNWLTHI